MELTTAVQRLAALAQDGRLAAFRRLVEAGEGGMAAGALAEALGVPANTLSAQLGVLASADLVESRRAGRSVIYRVRFDAMQALLRYLVEDCCQGRPELCAPLQDILWRCGLPPSRCAP